MSMQQLESATSFTDNDELIAKICVMFYERELPQKQIANDLGLTRPTVSRLLKKGKERDLVNFSISRPLNDELSEILAIQLKRQGVRHVVVSGDGRAEVGERAARFFESRVRSENTIVLDGGLTVRSFVAATFRDNMLRLKLCPLCSDPPSYATSSYELMTRLATKYPSATCEKLPYYSETPFLREQHKAVRGLASRANFVFLGTSPWDVDYTSLGFTKHLGCEPRQLRKKYNDVVCACGYLALTQDGHVRNVDEFESKMLRALSYSELRRIAKDDHRYSILLASGKDKADAVLTVSRSRMVNTLFVDVPLGMELVAKLS